MTERDEIDAAVDLLAVAAPDDASGALELSAGAIFGPFQLILEIGRGGLGHAFRARHVHPGYGEQDLALKILHTRVSSNSSASQHFRQEAYLMSMLRHPNVVRTFEAGSEDGRLFISMEYVSGRDLRQFLGALIRNKLKPPVELSVFIVDQLLSGLVAAHEMKGSGGAALHAVHQDVNPSNVLLGFDGCVKLGDFGVAEVFGEEVVRQRMVAGTAGYFSPEQLGDREFDHRTDIFSLGVIFYELLTLRRLFYSKDDDELLDMNERAEIPSVHKIDGQVSRELEEVVNKALARDPDDRFQSAREMQQALRAVCSPEPSMSLGLAAMLRTAFVSELSGELQLRHGLGRAEHEVARHHRVTLCAKPSQILDGTIDSLLEAGHWVELNESLGALGTSLEHGSPDVLLAELTSDSFSESVLNTAMSRRGSICPVVGLGADLGLSQIDRAHRMGASDILFGAIAPERMRTCLQAAVAGAGTWGPRSDADSRGGRYRAAFIALPPPMCTELRVLLEANSYLITEVTDEAAALLELESTTFHLLVVAADTPEAGIAMVDVIRAAPAMGPVPTLCLLPVVDSGRALGLPYTAVRSTREDAIVIAHSIEALQGEAFGVRRFRRFEVDEQAFLRFGGRERSVQVLDLSRAGAGIRVDHLPTVDSVVLLTMRVPASGESLAIRGRVAYVASPDPVSGTAEIGVVFTGFSRGQEALLIRHLVGLERASVALVS